MMLSDLIDALQDTLDNDGDMPVYARNSTNDLERFEIEEIQVNPTLEIVMLTAEEN